MTDREKLSQATIEYFQAKIELDNTCSLMQKEQTLYWKNKQLEGQMSSEMQPDESCEDYINRIQKENPKLMIAALQSSYMMVYHRMATKEQLFDLWFQENCQSEDLQSEFRRSETKDYRKWAIEKFNQLIDDNKIDITEIDIDELLGRGRR